MRSPLSKCEVLQPKSLEEALRMLSDGAPLTPLAGGTDLFVLLNAGALKQRRFIDLGGLADLRGVRKTREHLIIGGMATFTEIRRSPIVKRALPVLQEAARMIGGIQIQNRGTLAGNVANGSPAGDSLPVLAVSEAEVVLVGPSGDRRVPFNGFYTGYRKSVMAPNELIAGFRFPLARMAGMRFWFRKVGTRQAQAISKVVMAAGLRTGKAKRIEEARIAVGSVAPTVIRLPKTEAMLRGKRLDAALIARARECAMGEVSPIDDIRSTAEYRRAVVGNLVAVWLAR
ncbi:MAG: xanthine dehydrogenase family protein subunit M [Planctomycetota bacterium]